MTEQTKETLSFEEWHALLEEVARNNGGSAADADAWFDDYEAGRTPEQAWLEAWPTEDEEGEESATESFDVEEGDDEDDGEDDWGDDEEGDDEEGEDW